MKFQFKLLFKRPELGLIMAFMFLISIGTFAVDCIQCYNSNINSLVSSDQHYIGRTTWDLHTVLIALIPLIVSIPFADTYFEENQKNILPILITKYKNTKSYFISKALVVFFSAFLVIFFPLIFNIILNNITFPAETVKDYSNLSTDQTVYYIEEFVSQILFPNLFVKHPQLYNVVFCFALSLFSGLFSVLTYCISFFVKQSRILVLVAVFIINNIITIISDFTDDIGLNIDFFNYLLSYDLSDNKNLIVFAVCTLALLGNIIYLSKNAILKLNNIISYRE